MSSEKNKKYCKRDTYGIQYVKHTAIVYITLDTDTNRKSIKIYGDDTLQMLDSDYFWGGTKMDERIRI